MNKIPVVFDCDPGVDDTFALGLLASCELFDIKGITAVYGNMALSRTLYNAKALAFAFGINCPVAAGADKPLFKLFSRGEDYESPIHGKTGVGDMELPCPRDAYYPKDAAELIYDEAVKAEGELVLIAVGPLTNVAVALRRHPDLKNLIKKFYIMGGGIKMGNQTPFAEANICKDPTAAKICFEELETYMLGLNATHAAALTKEDFDEMRAACGDGRGGRVIKGVIDFSMENSFKRGEDNNIIHDALAVAWIMQEDICEDDFAYVYVEDRLDRENNGETIKDNSLGAPNCHIGMNTKKDDFKNLMVGMCRYFADK